MRFLNWQKSSGVWLFLRFIGPYMKEYRYKSCLYIFLQILQLSFMLMLPFLYRVLIDKAIPQKNIELLIELGFIIIIGLIIKSIISFLCEYIAAKLATAITSKIRLNVFTHLQELSFDFYNKTSSSDLLTLFNEDIHAVESALISGVPGIVGGLSLSIVSFFILLWISWPIAILILGLFLLIVYLPKQLNKHTEKALAVRTLEKLALMNTFREYIATELISRIYILQNVWREKFIDRITAARDAEFRSNLYVALTPQSIIASSILSETIIVVVGALMVILGKLTIGTLVSTIAFSTYFLSASNIIAFILPFLRLAENSIKNISKVMEMPKSYIESVGFEKLPPLKNSIHLNNVSFYGDHEKKILDEINLKIEIGKSVAFVGPTGSGKSTIIKLLLRLYDPTSGSIICDEKYKLAEVDVNSFREQLGVATQDTLLFNLSIYDNILMGKLDATQEEVIAAAKLAGLHDEANKLPHGYDTTIGEAGNKLSGGQKQKLALARALVRKPKILILDEITSSLDAISEAEIDSNLLNLAKYTTIILVTHRLNVAVRMDCIYVLNEGRITEHGTHKKLLHREDSLYAKLWKKQNSIVLAPENTIDHIDLGYLRHIESLQYFSDELLQELSQQFIVETYNQQDIVFNEGAFGDKFYLIARGQVEVLRGEELLPIANLEEGDYFGEIALMRHVPRNSTIRTKSACTLLALNQNQFESFLEKVPEVRQRLEEAIILRDQKTNGKM